MSFHKKNFLKPDNVFAPGFFWTWDTKLDKDILFAQMRDMAEHGFRSLCIHPFPKDFRPAMSPADMTPDYLTDDYFRRYAEVVDYAQSLGMNSWLYDEGGWPSGGACGQVIKRNVEQFSQRHFVKGEDGPKLKVADYTPNISAPYPSLLEKGVSEAFVELTHERYKNAIAKHFGKTVRFAFTDEPAVPIYFPHIALGWSTDFADEFKKRMGYDITPFIQELFDDPQTSDECRQRRIDYSQVRSELLHERFLKPLQDWCRANGLLSGGHFGGEDQPMGNPHYGYVHILRALRALDVPGVDVIWGQLFPNKSTFPELRASSREHFSLKDNGPFPKYASSAAHQNGSPYVLAETFAIYGDSLTPDTMKWLIDYMLVRGVTTFVFSYYPMKLKGAGMLGGGPHFGKPFTFWDAMPEFTRYISRTAAMLAQGKPDIHTAVLYDIKAIWAGGHDAQEAVEKHLAIAKKLDKACCDYDFIDDDQLAEATLTRGKALRIGKMTYDTIFLPTSKWLKPELRIRLQKLQAKGVNIIFGTDTDTVRPTARVTAAPEGAIRVCKRISGTQAVYFFVNESQKTVKAHIELDESAPLAMCDQESGKYIAIAADNGSFNWTFPPCGSALVMVNARADMPEPVRKCGKKRMLTADWTLRKVSSVAVGDSDFTYTDFPDDTPCPVELGDWRPVLGEEYSGKAAYANAFTSSDDTDAILDLGHVCYSADVFLNGRRLPRKFFGPFVYDVHLRKGQNTIEVIVSNTLSNATSPEHIRQRVYKAFPPVSVYEDRVKIINAINHESGLFGPVTVTPFAR